MNDNYRKIMKNFIKSLIFSLFAITTYAQQATEIDSKSVKLPRYADLAAMQAAIPTAQQGMMIYNTGTKTNWIFNGTVWVNQNSGNGNIILPFTASQNEASPLLDLKNTGSGVAGKFSGLQALEAVGNTKLGGNLNITGAIQNNGVSGSAGQILKNNGDETMQWSTLSTTFGNEKSLASDMELQKLLCNCQNELSTMMIKSLKNNGYTDKDLLDAGVSWEKIKNSYPILDRDGNEYTSIVIGTQTWLRENLRTTKFNDGTPISFWSGISTSPQYIFYENSTDLIFQKNHGALYNWYTVSSSSNGNKQVCPLGWHVPNISELTTLSTFLGNVNGVGVGKKMKEVSSAFWSNNDFNSNESGFSAKGSGQSNSGFTFNGLGSTARFLTIDEHSSTNFRSFALVDYDDQLKYHSAWNYAKLSPASIRCIKD